jgi:hypothetical protein
MDGFDTHETFGRCTTVPRSVITPLVVINVTSSVDCRWAQAKSGQSPFRMLFRFVACACVLKTPYLSKKIHVCLRCGRRFELAREGTGMHTSLNPV